ncbi:hypothetical protein [Pseudoalteromonas citrea]|nr:hypothetical protein [Pseudoalteromonas citrea]
MMIGSKTHRDFEEVELTAPKTCGGCSLTNDISIKLHECKLLKKQADGLTAWDMAKKVDLADQAISLSFEVMDGLIQKVTSLEQRMQEQAQ